MPTANIEKKNYEIWRVTEKERYSLRKVYSDVPTVWTQTELETDVNISFRQMNAKITPRFITKSLKKPRKNL